MYTHMYISLCMNLYMHHSYFLPYIKGFISVSSVQFFWIFTVLWWLWGNSEFEFMVDPGPYSNHFLWMLYIGLWDGETKPHWIPSLQADVTAAWSAAGLWVTDVVPATHLLVVCLHFSLNSILRFPGEITLSALWKCSLLGSKSPTNVVSPLTVETGSKSSLGPLSPHQQEVVLSLPGPMRISVSAWG